MSAPDPEFTRYRMFRWPLSDKANVAMVSEDDPAGTIVSIDIDLKGVTDLQQIEEMSRWALAWGGDNIAILEGAAHEVGNVAGEVPIVGISFVSLSTRGDFLTLPA